MSSNLIEYEVLKVGPELEKIKSALNDLGRRGFLLKSSQTSEEGIYTFILSKDTGISAEVAQDTSGDWVDDGFVNEETSWT